MACLRVMCIRGERICCSGSRRMGGSGVSLAGWECRSDYSDRQKKFPVNALEASGARPLVPRGDPLFHADSRLHIRKLILPDAIGTDSKNMSWRVVELPSFPNAELSCLTAAASSVASRITRT